MELQTKVESIQTDKGNTIVYDPDSSPKAWDYYQKIYTKEHWEYFGAYDFSTRFRRFYSWVSKGVPRKGYNYLNRPLKEYNRLEVAVFEKWESMIVASDTEDMFLQGEFRFGGETDFNFNALKYKKYQEIIGENDELAQRLTMCTKRHHTLANFSIMPVPGNLQGIKSEGLGDWLDRPDSFVYLLNNYLINPEKVDDILRKSQANRARLAAYLDRFIESKPQQAIYQYCNYIYCIYGTIMWDREQLDAETYVNMLIENGSKRIISAEDVLRYMELAEIMWLFKKKHFDLMTIGNTEIM